MVGCIKLGFTLMRRAGRAGVVWSFLLPDSANLAGGSSV